MVRRIFTGGLLMALALAIAGVGLGDDPAKVKLPPPATNANLEKMKKLVGTWVKADKDGKATAEVVSVVKLTAGGSVVHETLFPGQPMEMVSVYAVDGHDLYMTHYCVLGNQPKMKADPKSPANKIVFEFVGGGNLDVKKDKHMHSAVLTIVDNDNIVLDGCGWENGGPAKEMCGAMKLVRKK